MSIENLTKEKAVEKIQELAKDANICFFVTNLTSLPLSARPMGTQTVDEEGNIWFFSKEDSNKNMEIENDDRVQLFYCNNGSSEYLSVFGHASISKDHDKIEELWSPIVKAWFPEGKDDPTLSLIKVNTTDAYYWDTKSNKLVSLIKIAVAAVTGKPGDDDGVEGTIKL